MFKRYIEKQVALQMSEELIRVKNEVEEIKRTALVNTKSKVIEDLLATVNSRYSSFTNDERQEIQSAVEYNLWDKFEARINKQIPTIIEEELKSESFIDSIVKRIKDKQL